MMAWPWIVLLVWPFVSLGTGILVGRWLAWCSRADEEVRLTDGGVR